MYLNDPNAIIKWLKANKISFYKEIILSDKYNIKDNLIKYPPIITYLNKNFLSQKENPSLYIQYILSLCEEDTSYYKLFSKLPFNIYDSSVAYALLNNKTCRQNSDIKDVNNLLLILSSEDLTKYLFYNTEDLDIVISAYHNYEILVNKISDKRKQYVISYIINNYDKLNFDKDKIITLLCQNLKESYFIKDMLIYIEYLNEEYKESSSLKPIISIISSIITSKINLLKSSSIAELLTYDENMHTKYNYLFQKINDSVGAWVYAAVYTNDITKIDNIIHLSKYITDLDIKHFWNIDCFYKISLFKLIYNKLRKVLNII